MNNNDIFKKLRVAIQLRDDQIVSILELVNFRISKGEVGNFFRNADHPKYVECGDQILRNFLNGLVIYLRGTKEEPKNPMEVIKNHKPEATPFQNSKKTIISPAIKTTKNTSPTKPQKKEPIVERVKFNNGKKKS